MSVNGFSEDVKSTARRYVNRGIAVIPLWGIDPVTGYCTCKLAEQCSAPGKHPYTPIVPHGARDATTNEAAIDMWPDGLNLGIQPTLTMVCLDFDEPNVVQRLLDLLDDDPEGTHMASRSLRGVHFWVEADTALASGTVLHDSNGLKLADVKARGLVVVEPSVWAGNVGHYRWMGPSLAYESPPKVTGTAVDHAERLLKRLGISLSKKQRGASWSAPRNPVPQMPGGTSIPVVGLRTFLNPDDPAYAFDEVDLRQLENGIFPFDDRSETLYRYACEIWRAADRRADTLDPVQVGGAVKELDRRANWAKGSPKFATRPPDEEDKLVWDLVNDARISVTLDAQKAQKAQAKASKASSQPPPGATPPPPQPPPGAPPGSAASPPGPLPPSPSASQYVWDAPSSTFTFRPAIGRNKQPVLICNFEPVLVEIHNVWREPTVQDAYWLVRFGAVDILLGPQDIGDERTFRKTVSVGMAKHPLQTVQNWHHLFVGMREHAAGRSLPEVERYSMTGWRPGYDEYIDVHVTVTANGPAPCLYEDPTALPPFLRLGVSERPDASAAFGALIHSVPPTLVAPLLSQTLGAALLSVAGDEWPKYILHQRGRSGLFKTSIIRLFASIYGANWQTYPVTSWISTATSFEQAAHRYRDLPALFDDYKTSLLNREKQQEINKFIQTYADSSGRSRSTRNLTERQVLVGRGLIISTGESEWGGRQESGSARTIEVEALDNTDAWSEPLREAYAIPMHGVGWAWLRWCCQQGQAALRAELEQYRREESEHPSNIHKRVASSVAALRAFSRLAQRWVNEVFPEHALAVSEIMREGWEGEAEKVKQDAAMAADMEPFTDFITVVQAQVLTGKAVFHPRIWGGGKPDEGLFLLPHHQGAEVVGYVDPEAIYLSAALSFDWFERSIQRRGASLPYSWRAVIDGGKGVGAVAGHYRITGTERPVYMLRVPREAFFGSPSAVEAGIDAVIRETLGLPDDESIVQVDELYGHD